MAHSFWCYTIFYCFSYNQHIIISEMYLLTSNYNNPNNLMKNIFIITGLLIFFSSLGAQDCGDRYFNKIFNTKQTTALQYGSNVKFNGDSVNLLMDIFEPENDTLSKRPLIVLAFGGSFTGGVRQSPDIVRLCNEFSQRGYVCVSIDYRLGFENGNDSDTNQFKALIRGVQDMKGALRYFYKDAATDNIYRVDTNNIFAGGVSAGAFIGLNMAYGRTDIFSRIVPAWVPDALAEVGGVEGNSGSPGYSWKVKGVINLCGAISDTLWLQPNDPMVVSVHGTADDLVPFYFDSTLAGTQVEALLFGSGDIHNRANRIGLKNYLKAFQGAGHVPFILPSGSNITAIQKYMDTTIWTIRDFLYNQAICNTTSSAYTLKPAVAATLFPNPAGNYVTVKIETADPLQLSLYNMYGKEVLKTILNRNETLLQLNALPKDIYIAEIKNNQNHAIVNRQRLLIE
jgi:para-nitrobenzyl esterase